MCRNSVAAVLCDTAASAFRVGGRSVCRWRIYVYGTKSLVSSKRREIRREKAMASRDESSVPRKQSSDVADEISTFNAENMQNNAKIIYYSRTFMSIIGGVIAGILGFTGLTGFIVYFLVMAITSVGIAAKAGFSVLPYFNSWNQILIDGFLGGLLSFVLFWTFAYDFVHIF
ncbi:unnamed protein product [Fraxinus pennsylvanica]|uniref:ER membrane protein complex subunit 6 n=1 Tax=Fraxinus pennsylvanica TaxID=56036 RepID=A0AAD2DQK6_9LAMI|nr:unnamed protein product [Fraxinus pennsylvanica]